MFFALSSTTRIDRLVMVTTGATGSVNTNLLPSPGLLSTQIRPLCSSTKRFDSASPSPVPSRCSLPAAACWNSSKIRTWSSSAMPGPSSVTETRTSPLTRAAVTSIAPPGGLNLTAFESRLKTTCLTRARPRRRCRRRVDRRARSGRLSWSHGRGRSPRRARESRAGRTVRSEGRSVQPRPSTDRARRR